jgi:hypothetical protein
MGRVNWFNHGIVWKLRTNQFYDASDANKTA